MKQQKNIFIVFDGIDGNGKSAQVEILKKYLEKLGFDVFLISEPSEGEYGKKIENLLRRKEAARVSKEKWLELFRLDTKDVVRNIKTALEERKIVICDRYYYSTLAYQLDEEEWQEYTKEFLMPTITFIIDVPADIALERVKEKYEITKEKRSYFEKLKILRKTRKKFLLLPNYLKDNIKIIEGNRPIQTVAKDIKKEIDILMKT
ncbi:MAG: dTMP kinase [Candidatus Pacearchaeota archaeon]|nr:MAG: dTMP kinase [Candidatus Pacearchaeota archaeon]